MIYITDDDMNVKKTHDLSNIFAAVDVMRKYVDKSKIKHAIQAYFGTLEYDEEGDDVALKNVETILSSSEDIYELGTLCYIFSLKRIDVFLYVSKNLDPDNLLVAFEVSGWEKVLLDKVSVLC